MWTCQYCGRVLPKEVPHAKPGTLEQCKRRGLARKVSAESAVEGYLRSALVRDDTPFLQRLNQLELEKARRIIEGLLELREPIVVEDAPTGMRPRTKTQRLIYDWLLAFLLEHHRKPSIREVMRRFRYKSPNGPMVHIRQLARKGWLEPSGSGWRFVGIKLRAEPLAEPLTQGETNGERNVGCI